MASDVQNNLNIVCFHSSLPELLEMKRLIDLHTSIATAMLRHIKAINSILYYTVYTRVLAALHTCSYLYIVDGPPVLTGCAYVRSNKSTF